jgi:galactokinase
MPYASELQIKVTSAFQAQFHEAPTAIVRAPGRVNLIGEHTDYNDGFVMPMAIDRAVLIALRPRNDDRVRVYSVDFGVWGEFSLQALSRDKGWLEYLKGIAWALQEAGYSLRGWEGVVSGDVPRGSGLSSSAALEMATARAFYAVSGFPWDARQMALLGQRCENVWVGAKTGIMDQLISAAGRKGYALLIDCRSLELSPVQLPEGTAVVVMDTMTRHTHTDSGYNTRRAECEQAARHFGVRALRDVTPLQFAAEQAGLSEVVMRRARHVMSENQRTLDAAEAMRAGDAARLGALMNASHESLRHDFEVTNDALNTMVAIARAQAGCLGARMTGGGFGGCAVALVRQDAAAAFCQAVRSAYQQATDLEPQIYRCEPAEGASTLSPDGVT